MKHFLTLHFFIFLAFCADISVRELGLLRILESFRKNEKDVVSEPGSKIPPTPQSKMHNGILYFINERIAFLKKVIELVFTGYWNALVRDRNSENSTEA